MNEQNELLPCPFCGGKPIFDMVEGKNWGFLRCPCSFNGVAGIHTNSSTKEQLIEFWNTRKSSPAVTECKCLYESDCHGIEIIKSPSGKEWAIGGTETKDRFKFCPWCGGKIWKG